MQRRPLGTSGLETSVIGLGTWAMSGTVAGWGLVDDRESIAAIHQALNNGINLIDTAPTYGLGHSEEIVGNAIRGRRQEVVLATTCGLRFPLSEDDRPHRCLSASEVFRQCDESLRRLRVDVIDLYQCHWPDPETPIDETMNALLTLRERGKIRAIGVSNFNCEELAAALACGPVHALHTRFSMLNPRAAHDLFPFCKERQIGVIAYSPLAKGLLTGKFDVDSRFEGLRARDPDFLGERYRRNLRVVEALRKVATRYARTVAQLVINWTVVSSGVTSMIIGAKRPSQVVENVGGVGWSIREEDRADIGRILEGFLDAS